MTERDQFDGGRELSKVAQPPERFKQGVEFSSPASVFGRVEANCPYCERVEEFEHRADAKAWIVGHIQEEHEWRLPSYEGTADTDE
jgi:hypothetical protein